MADYSAEDRRKMAASGAAMPDGSYPIANRADLENAIHAVGRGSGSHTAIRAHIVKRAKALGAADLLPDDWTMAESLHSLVFADQPNAEDGLSAPFAVLHTGTFKRGDFGELKVTEADLDRAVENFASLTHDEQGNPEAPIDEDHAFSKGQKAPAKGWIKSLAREGDKLLARVKWTPEAADAIRSGAYRYISPEFTPTWKDQQGADKGFALLAAGLTNRPFLKSLPPVALSDEVASDLREHAQRWLDAAGPEAGGDPAQHARKTPAMADEPTTIALSEAEVTQLREAASQVATLTEKVTALEESRDQAVTALNDTKAELRKEQVDKLLGQARREGRIDAADETTAKWHERADKHGVEFVKDLLNEFPAESIPMTERGQGFDKPLDKAPDGVDADDYALNKRVEARMAEKSISFTEAFNQIADEVAAEEARV